MNTAPGPIRLFQVAVHAWLIGFVLSTIPSAEWLWDRPVSPELPVPGVLGHLTHAFSSWLPGGAWLLLLSLLLALSVRNLFRPMRWWSAALVWFCYVNLMHRAWMAGSGGQQLMANLLFWNIALTLASGEGAFRTVASATAFWIMRFQLLLAYVVTGMYKLMGLHWLDGTALGIAATDPAFGPDWMGHLPGLSVPLTWSVLMLQFAIPLGVWFRRTRIPVLLLGTLFHLATAIWMGIPDMAFAFIAAYAIWLSQEEAERVPGVRGKWFSGKRRVANG